MKYFISVLVATTMIAPVAFGGKDNKKKVDRKVSNSEAVHLSCSFERSYTFEHLKKHPDQQISFIKGKYVSNSQVVTLDVRLRDREELLTTGTGECGPIVNTTKSSYRDCSFDGDSGSVRLSTNSNGKWTVTILRTLRVESEQTGPDGILVGGNGKKGGDDIFVFSDECGI